MAIFPEEKQPLEVTANDDNDNDKVDIRSQKEEIFEDSTSLEFDMVGLEANDVILHRKMVLINDAIDEIGFTPYHLKLFFLNGMGYCTDCMLTYLESSVRTLLIINLVIHSQYQMNVMQVV